MSCHPQLVSGFVHYDGKKKTPTLTLPTGEGTAPCHSEFISESHVEESLTGQDPTRISKFALAHKEIQLTSHKRIINPFVRQSPVGEGKDVPSYLTLHTSLKQKCAFTLAEVLITLGIIGIVAAMTLPGLVTKYRKQQAVNQLKKSYTVLAQAIKISEVKNGSLDYWDYKLSAKEFFEKYLSGYMSVSNNTISGSGIVYKYLNGGNCTEELCTGSSHFVFLADGSSLAVSRHRSLDNGRVIMIDINGYKQPNTLGKDVFTYAIIKGYGLAPFGYKGFGFAADEDANPDAYNQVFGEYDRDVLTGGKAFACNKDKYGFWCAALILMDGWEMKDDYPWY